MNRESRQRTRKEGRAGPPCPAEPMKGRALSPRAQAKEVRTRSPKKSERRSWSLPFTPLSPVPPEVEPYLSHSRRAVTIHAAGDKWADRGGSALPQGGWSSRPPVFKIAGRAGPPRPAEPMKGRALSPRAQAKEVRTRSPRKAGSSLMVSTVHPPFTGSPGG